MRAYVMGQRGPAHEVATPDEIEGDEARRARGHRGRARSASATSRTEKHKRQVDGKVTPSITAHADELTGIAKALGEAGKGVLQGISDFYDFEEEFAMFRKMTEASGRPCSITVEQQDARPDWWLQLLEAVTQSPGRRSRDAGPGPAARDGRAARADRDAQPVQRSASDVPCDAIFDSREASSALRRWSERVENLRKPEVRDAILSEVVDVQAPNRR